MAKNVGETLRQMEKERDSKERFLVWRMWFSTLISLRYPDRVRIPENIGNNIFIGNNQVVTRNSMATYILLKEFSEETPIAFLSKLIKDVKTNVEGVTIDYIIKNRRYNVNLQDGGLKSRVKQWTNTLENDSIPDRIKMRAARLLYTVDIIRTGEVLFISRVYLVIRTKDGATDRNATGAVEAYLRSKKISFRTIRSKLQSHIEYNSLLSNKLTDKIKDIPYSIQSATTLAELLPSTQGHNDEYGNMLGVDRYNRSPYMVDFQSSAAAKNILVIAPSGKGKTYLLISWEIDSYAIGFNIATMDLKGNEFKSVTDAMNGMTIPMRQDSRKFINTLVMNAKHIEEDALSYFNNRFLLTIDMMSIIVDAENELESRVISILNDFLQAFYTGEGVLADNPNTWVRTEGMHPHQLYQAFMKYLSKDVKMLYADVADKVATRFKMFFDKKGSHAYIFLEEFRFDEIYERKAVTYDFGLLDSIGVKDTVVFKLHVMFMKVINNEFSRHKKAKGEWTLKVLEEGQIAEDYLLKMYAEEFSIRRAQNQVTAVITNSIQSIKNRPEASPILENANIIVIGAVNSTTRDYLIEEYGLEPYRWILEKLVDDPAYDNTFLIINRMKSGSTNALLRVFNPDDVSQGKIYKVVDIKR